jgi:hypothetical protein
MTLTPDNLPDLLIASIFLARLARLEKRKPEPSINVYRVYGEDVAGAVAVFALNEVEAERCARAIDAKLRSYAGKLVCRYIRTVAVPKRKEQVA